jgi:hypothetical protein
MLYNVLLGFSLVLLALSGALTMRAMAHLNPDRKLMLRAISLGSLAPREYFTERGWKYKQAGLACGVLAMGLFFIWAVLH